LLENNILILYEENEERPYVLVSNDGVSCGPHKILIAPNFDALYLNSKPHLIFCMLNKLVLG
jgi:hypothetical protein